MIAWWIAPHSLLFFLPLIVQWTGFFLTLHSLWTWNNSKSFKDNIGRFIIGLSLTLFGSLLWDFYVSPFINSVWNEWIFYIPIGLRNYLPIWKWDATVWLWGDAYVRFFLLEWIGFVISWFSLWFWEE